MEKGSAVQILLLCALMVAIGLTVTVRVKALPVQEPEAGVTL